MANLSTEELRRLARLGAVARLEQIRGEEEMIRREFPELFGGSAGRGRGRKRAAAGDSESTGAPRRRRRKPMTAAQRKAVSERMRRYWADRRKAKAGK